MVSVIQHLGNVIKVNKGLHNIVLLHLNVLLKYVLKEHVTRVLVKLETHVPKLNMDYVLVIIAQTIPALKVI